MPKFTPGAPAPAISLPDQDGKTRSLAEQRGKWVLVYFYPRDDTPGCTVEACGLRDAWSDFARHGIEVFGISADSVKSHRKFADKFKLPFTLLADESMAVIRAYRSYGKKKFLGREFDGILRQSFLVDPQGKLAKVYLKVKPNEHAAEVLADVALLKGGSAAAPKAAGANKPSAKKAKAPGPKTPAPKASQTPARKSAAKVPAKKKPAPKTPAPKAGQTPARKAATRARGARPRR